MTKRSRRTNPTDALSRVRHDEVHACGPIKLRGFRSLFAFRDVPQAGLPCAKPLGRLLFCLAMHDHDGLVHESTEAFLALFHGKDFSLGDAAGPLTLRQRACRSRESNL